MMKTTLMIMAILGTMTAAHAERTYTCSNVKAPDDKDFTLTVNNKAGTAVVPFKNATNCDGIHYEQKANTEEFQGLGKDEQGYYFKTFIRIKDGSCRGATPKFDYAQLDRGLRNEEPSGEFVGVITIFEYGTTQDYRYHCVEKN